MRIILNLLSLKMMRDFSEKKRSLKSAPFFLGVVAIWTGSTLFCQNNFAATSSNSWSEELAPSSSSRKLGRNHDLSKELGPFTPGSNNIALDLGQVFLMGDLGKYSDSIGTQLHYTYGVSDLFGFDSSFGYSQHSDGQLSMLSLLTGLRLNLTWYDKIVPYGVFGLGFYKPSYQDRSVPGGGPSLSSILFGVHVGPGVDLELSRNLFFGAALTFHTLFGSTQTLANGSAFNIGGSYISFFVHLGATF